MRQDFKEMQILYAQAESFEQMRALPAKCIFDESVCGFLHELSLKIRMDEEARAYPEIAAFGFFCRKANIQQLKQEYDCTGRLGRGFSFHIAPSNVPMNFAYTLAAGLLAGNACVVRVSSREFPHTEIICRLIQEAAAGPYAKIGAYIAIIRYARIKQINDYFSAMADLRVVWGGDHTVREIQSSPASVRCMDVVFADRYSICVIYAQAVLEQSDLQQTAQNFYKDTYQYDQNACTSPRLVYWVGAEDAVACARVRFWKAVRQYVFAHYEIEPFAVVEKLLMDCKMALEWEGVTVEPEPDYLLHRVRVRKLEQDMTDFVCPCGSFVEYESRTLEDLGQIVTPKYQTLSYFGGSGSAIAAWVMRHGLKGIDRIVPMGQTMDFHFNWDGYDLMETMSRKIKYI